MAATSRLEHSKTMAVSNACQASNSSERKKSDVNKEDDGSGERCNICGRVFRDATHLSKHRRGALCRRLVQRIARKHRKIALSNNTSSDKDASIEKKSQNLKKKSSGCLLVYKPYQCNVCGAKFYDKVNVELHLERQHHTTQPLWVEMTKVRKQAHSESDRTLVNNNICENVSNRTNGGGSNSTTNSNNLNVNNAVNNSSSNNAYIDSCLAVNNNPRAYDSDRLKCIECNITFHSESQYNEHKRLLHNHNIGHSSLDPSLPHAIVQQVTSTNNRNLINPYTVPVCTDPSDATLNKPMLGRIDNASNVAANHQQIASGYLFPSSYYGSDPTAVSMQQATTLQQQQQPHGTYLAAHQQQHPVHHHAMHHQAQQQHHHLSQQQQQHEQDLTSHSHNNIMHNLHSVQQLHHGLSPQFTTLASADAPTQLIPMVDSNQIPSTSQTNASATTNDDSFLTNITVSGMSLTNGNSANNQVGHSNCVSSNTHATALSSANITSSASSTCQNSSVCSATTSNTTVTSVNLDKTIPNVNTRWNMCGECGIKFLDLMNLELHVERKHPHLKIFGSVDLGLGTVCYKTGVINVKGSNSKSDLTRQLSKDIKVAQRHTCSLCNHKTTSMVTMVDHMLNIHFLTGKNMMDAIYSEGDLKGNVTHQQHKSSVQKKNNSSQLGNSSQLVQKPSTSNSSTTLNSPRLSKEPIIALSDASKCSQNISSNQCHSCKAEFNSSAELIRHRIKDKTLTCIVCCYVTCSREELAGHMKAEHDWNDMTYFKGGMPELDKKLTCFRCPMEFKKTGNFVEHIKKHGTLIGKCEKCGKQDYNVASILIHMTTLHGDYMNKLTITIISKGKTWTCTYMQTLTGDLVNINPSATNTSSKNAGSSGNTDSLKKRNKSRTRRSVDVDKETSHYYEKSTGLETPMRQADVYGEVKLYACSQCRICLVGTKLEEHLKEHQTLLTCGNASINSAIKRSPSEEGLFPCDEETNRSVVRLGVLPNTVGFKCQECGLTKQKSDPLIRHIKKVHLSGNILHMIRDKYETIKDYPISVVTPISSVR